jgi:hypothetical protein
MMKVQAIEFLKINQSKLEDQAANASQPQYFNATCLLALAALRVPGADKPMNEADHCCGYQRFPFP